jgi:hypothetical protein
VLEGRLIEHEAKAATHRSASGPSTARMIIPRVISRAGQVNA